MTYREEATQKIRAVPKEWVGQKIKRTTLGAFFLAGAVGVAWMAWPWYVSVGLALVGAHIMSSELVEKALGYLLATFRDFLPKRNSRG